MVTWTHMVTRTHGHMDTWPHGHMVKWTRSFEEWCQAHTSAYTHTGVGMHGRQYAWEAAQRWLRAVGYWSLQLRTAAVWCLVDSVHVWSYGRMVTAHRGLMRYVPPPPPHPAVTCACPHGSHPPACGAGSSMQQSTPCSHAHWCMSHCHHCNNLQPGMAWQ